ncbi:MAG: DUF3592 domain-containing protein [Pseudomonadota bacterium]
MVAKLGILGIVGGILLVIGALCVWLAVGQINRIEALNAESLSAIATVVEKERRESKVRTQTGDGRTEYAESFVLVMTFTPEGGDLLEVRGTVDEEGYARIDVGDAVEIFYAPADPTNFAWTATRSTGPVVAFAVFGGILIAIALGLIALQVRGARFFGM